MSSRIALLGSINVGGNRLHMAHLEHPVAARSLEAFKAGFVGPERIAMCGSDLFNDYATGVAGSRIDSALKEAKLITGRATARNIRSLRRILVKMDR